MNGSDSITVMWKVSEEQRVYEDHLVNQKPCHSARSKADLEAHSVPLLQYWKSKSIQKVSSVVLLWYPFPLLLAPIHGMLTNTPKKSTCMICMTFPKARPCPSFEYRCAHWQCTVSCIMNMSETWFNFFKTNLSFLIDSLKQRPV